MPAEGGPEVQILPSVYDRSWALVDQGIWFIDQALTEIVTA